MRISPVQVMRLLSLLSVVTSLLILTIYVHGNHTNSPKHSVYNFSKSTNKNYKNSEKLLFQSIVTYDFGDPGLDKLISDCSKDGYKVPNIVHFVWLGNQPLVFHQFISIFSAHKYLRPCRIFFHCDALPTGQYWKFILDDVTEIVQVTVNNTSHVYGRLIKMPEHRSDVIRLEALIRYGGIYLDTDTVVIRDFYPLRNNTLTMDRTDSVSINSAAILAQPGSAFLKLWHLAYNTFEESEWGSHSVIMAHRLQRIYPHLITVLHGNLTFLGGGLETQLVDYHWPKTAYAMHLYVRLFTKKDYTFTDVMFGRNTFAALCRHTLFGSRDPLVLRQAPRPVSLVGKVAHHNAKNKNVIHFETNAEITTTV